MANTDLYIGIANGVDGYKLNEITIGSTSGNTDIELHIKATDANGNTISRKNVMLAICAFERVLGSMSTFTTDLAF